MLAIAGMMASKFRPLLPQRKEVTFMTKAELVDQVVKASKAVNLSKKAAGEILDIVFDEVGKAIKKDARFSYPGFGTFTVKKRAARKGRNPRTGEDIKIKASRTVGFKPAPTLKKTL
jgi:DNA-binding protein HU-beta